MVRIRYVNNGVRPLPDHMLLESVFFVREFKYYVSKITEHFPALVKASRCKQQWCNPECMAFKRLLLHVKKCKGKLYGGCEICRPLLANCMYHATNCTVDDCAFPFCSNVYFNQERLKHYYSEEEKKKFSISNDDRCYAVGMIWRATNSKKFIPLAEKYEKKIFNVATSNEQYYKLMKEKIYEIRKLWYGNHDRLLQTLYLMTGNSEAIINFIKKYRLNRKKEHIRNMIKRACIENKRRRYIFAQQKRKTDQKQHDKFESISLND